MVVEQDEHEHVAHSDARRRHGDVHRDVPPEDPGGRSARDAQGLDGACARAEHEEREQRHEERDVNEVVDGHEAVHPSTPKNVVLSFPGRMP